VYDLAGASLEKSKFMIKCHRGQDIDVKVNVDGHAILIWSSNLTDDSGKSYYGEHSLQYVQIFGGRERSHVPVFDDIIHDVAWVPNGEQFIVISGQ